MPEQIISSSGTQYGLIITPEGRALVDMSGTSIFIGSVSANVDSIYVQSGLIHIDETPNVSSNPELELFYITSGTATGVTGSEIGSIVKFIGAGSYVQTLTYTDNNLTNVGSFV